MAKQLYTMRLPKGASKEKLNNRAKELNTTVARLMDFAMSVILDSSPYFLKYMGELSGQLSMAPGVIVDKIILDRKARRDAYAKQWGADNRVDLTFAIADDKPLIGQEYYDFIFESYNQQEQQNREDEIFRQHLEQPEVELTPEALDFVAKARADTERAEREFGTT